MKNVSIYTDGACLGNPGRGGWAAIIVGAGKEIVLKGGTRDTTNNKMELTAVIEGLRALGESCNVTVYSDSKYVVDGVSKGWAYSWRRNGWRKSDGKRALNVELWTELLDLLDKHDVVFKWVKGHNGHPYNERCDELATGYAASL